MPPKAQPPIKYPVRTSLARSEHLIPATSMPTFRDSIPGSRIYVPQAYGVLLVARPAAAEGGGESGEAMAVAGGGSGGAAGAGGGKPMGAKPVVLHALTTGAGPCVILGIHVPPAASRLEKFFLAHLDEASAAPLSFSFPAAAGGGVDGGGAAGGGGAKATAASSSDWLDHELEAIRRKLGCRWSEATVSLMTGGKQPLLAGLYCKLISRVEGDGLVAPGRLYVDGESNDGGILLQDYTPRGSTLALKRGAFVRIATASIDRESYGRDRSSLGWDRCPAEVSLQSFYIRNGLVCELELPAHLPRPQLDRREEPTSAASEAFDECLEKYWNGLPIGTGLRECVVRCTYREPAATAAAAPADGFDDESADISATAVGAAAAAPAPAPTAAAVVSSASQQTYGICCFELIDPPVFCGTLADEMGGSAGTSAAAAAGEGETEGEAERGDGARGLGLGGAGDGGGT